MNKSMNKLTALVLVLAIMLLALVGCDESASKSSGETSEPKTETMTEATLPAKEPTTADLLMKLKDNAANGYTLTIDAKDDSGEYLPVNIAASVICDMTGKRTEAFANIGNTEGESLLAALLFASADELVLSLSPIIEDTYGISFKTIAEDFASSVFAPGSGSSLELDEGTYNAIAKIITALAGTEKDDASAEKLTEILTDYQNFAVEQYKEMLGVKTNALTGTVTLSGRINNATLNAFVKNFAEKLDKDDRIKDVMISVVKSFVGDDSVTDDDIKALLEGFTFSDYMPDMNDADKYDITVDGELSETAGRITAKDTESGDSFEFIYTAGDGKLSEALTATIDGETMTLMTVDAETDGNIMTITSVATNDESSVTVTVSASGGKYTAAIEADQSGEKTTITVSGTYAVSETSLEVKADDVTVETPSTDVHVKSIHVTVKIEAGAELHDAPEYKNIVKLSEEKMASLVELFSGLFGGDDPDDPYYPDDPADFEPDPELLSENSTRIVLVNPGYVQYLAYAPYECLTLDIGDDKYASLEYYTDYGFLTGVEVYSFADGEFTGISYEWFEYDENGLLTWYTPLEPDPEGGYSGSMSYEYSNGAWSEMADE